MKKMIVIWLSSLLLAACSSSVTDPEMVGTYPEIYPDYIGVTIPVNIAPMDFDLPGDNYDRVDVLVKGCEGKEIHVKGKDILFPENEWHRLLAANEGDSIVVTVSIQQNGKWKQFRPFPMFVSPYRMDYGVVYRKIAPGYCLNCHSFNRTNPDFLSIHFRGSHGATLMQVNGKNELLNTKTDSTLSACVYPYWHPTGKYIAYSVNNTRQGFHAVKDERIEVLDFESDVLVYKPDTHELLLSPLLQKKESFETFPAFSPDGRTLYFCSAESKEIPAHYKDIRYNLCKIAFDPDNGMFGEKIDTLVNAEKMKKSISFPRPSYDGKYLMFTLSDYGNFSIWHKEADLWILDLRDGSLRELKEVNSVDTESFHNWSANSHWFVFSSRRDDGLYTRLYFACIDDKGRISKPFMLPQEHPFSYYDNLIYSYNVPDFVNRPIELEHKSLGERLLSSERVNVNVR